MSFLCKFTPASLAAGALIAAPSAAVASTAQPTMHTTVAQPDNRSREVGNGDLAWQRLSPHKFHQIGQVVTSF